MFRITSKKCGASTDSVVPIRLLPKLLQFFSEELFPTIASYIKSIKESDIVIFRIPCPGYCLVSALCIMLNKPVVAFVSGNIKTQSDTFNSSHGIKKIFLSFLLVARVRLHRFFWKKLNIHFTSQRTCFNCIVSRRIDMPVFYEHQYLVLRKSRTPSKQIYILPVRL